MDIFTIFMDNNTFQISINTRFMPLLADCAVLTAASPFWHVDRICDFNVMICVIEGVMYVTEGNADYEIHQGEVLFLKSGIRHFSKRLTPGGTKWFYAHFFADRSVFPEYNSGMPAGEYNIPLPKKANVSGDYIRKLIAFSNGVHALAPDMILKHNSSFYELLTELVFLSNAETETLSDKICAFLDTQFNKPFTKELIEAMSLS